MNGYGSEGGKRGTKEGFFCVCCCEVVELFLYEKSNEGRVYVWFY